MANSGKGMRALIVGTGFGCRIQVPALRGAGFEVAGLVGSNAGRTAQRATDNDIVHAYTDLDTAIDETRPDVVAISTPPHLHGEVALKAMARGCHVLCEKPFARDADEARGLLDAARRAGVVHMIGHEFRFEPQRATLGRAIADGLIGEPRFASLTQFMPYMPNYEQAIPAWWFDPACGGGWLGASGSHAIDQLRAWLGDFRSVSGQALAITATRGPVDDTFSMIFRMGGGVEGVLQYVAGDWGPMADITRVAGSTGSLRIEGGKVWLTNRDGDRELPVPADLALPAPPPVGGDPRHAEPRWQMLVALELAPYIALCDELARAIRGEPGPRRAATFADGLACMEVIDAIRASAREGGRLVELPG